MFGNVLTEAVRTELLIFSRSLVCGGNVWTLECLKQAVCKDANRTISKSTIHRILTNKDIRPHKHKMWLHSPDPAFKKKTEEIYSLYLNPPKDAHLLCIDGKTRTAEDLIKFMEKIAVLYPKGEVHILWDNLNIHHGNRWKEFNERHEKRFYFHYTPVHASWLNQIEIFLEFYSDVYCVAEIFYRKKSCKNVFLNL